MKKFIYGLFFVLCACSFRSPSSSFYMMSSNGLSAVSERKMNVAVARVKVSDLLDRAQMIAYEKNSDQVQILEFNRWGESFPEMLQATITNDLIAYLPNSFIKRTYFDNGHMLYGVNVEINSMKAYPGDKVILSAWWNIANSGGIVLKRQQVSYEVSVKGNSIQDMVDAQSEAVHKMSRDIAEALVKL
ncbi:MAG: PqiC family protein [Alphaproteobacteria bacterium]|nr:PqiC family protein [Alphaproteobacteria bacterium]